MLVVVTLMIASVGSTMVGSGTVSTLTFGLPCHVTARTLIDLFSQKYCSSSPARNY
jgi:hypothetical protein